MQYNGDGEDRRVATCAATPARRSCAGYTMVELMMSVVLLALCSGAILSLGMIKSSVQVDVDKQYALVAADAMIHDIYTDFHDSKAYQVNDSEPDVPGTSVSLIFDKGEAGSTIYEYDATTRMCSKDGQPQFKASSMDITVSANNLYLRIKMEGDHALEVDAYR